MKRIVLAILLVAAACGREAKTVRGELAATRVGAGLHLVAEGERSGFNGFQYRLYAGPDSVDRSVLTPPSASYQRHALPADFHNGWAVVVAWNGPSSDGTRECLITAEVPERSDVLPADLTAEERSELDGVVGTVLRVAASCTLSQHHFERTTPS